MLVSKTLNVISRVSSKNEFALTNEKHDFFASVAQKLPLSSDARLQITNPVLINDWELSKM